MSANPLDKLPVPCAPEQAIILVRTPEHGWFVIYGNSDQAATQLVSWDLKLETPGEAPRFKGRNRKVAP